MDNESSNRLEASDFWQLCNEFDTIDDSGSGSQHSDSCSSDPDGFVYPPSNHSSPTVVGVAVKRSLKVADDLNRPIHRNMNRMATPSGDVMDDDGSAPIVDFDDVDVEEGVDVFYECNNNNAKNIAMNDAKNGGHVANLVDTVDGRGPERCGLDGDSLTDLFLKKYHAHNELIENNYYCINTKKIEETINLIDLNDDDAIRPVVIDTCGEAQVPVLRVQQTETEARQPHRTSDHRGAGDVVDGNNTNHITKSGEQKTSPFFDSARLLNVFDSDLNEIVGSHLGDTVCTNHLLDNVREEIAKLKVNVDEFQINRINGTNVLTNVVDNCTATDRNCYGRKESESSQLSNSIINQCTTGTGKRTRSISDEGNDGANVDAADDTDGHGKIFFFLSILFLLRLFISWAHYTWNMHIH